MPVHVIAIQDVTLTGVSGLGRDVVLRTGEKFLIDEATIAATGNEILAELQAKKGSGHIQVVVDKDPNPHPYEDIDEYLDDRVDTFVLGAGAPTQETLTGALLNTNAEAGTFSDILADLQAADASTGSNAITVFPNPSASNACFFVGSSSPIPGIDVQIRAAKAGGDTAVITCQYWNGATWITHAVMAADRVEPFTRRWVGTTLMNTTGGISMWFDVATVALQVAKIVNGSEAMYWVRYIISSGSIAASAITVSKLRIHQNASVFSATGVRVNYGTARRGELIAVPLDMIPGSDGPTEVDVTVSANVDLTYHAEHPESVDTFICGQMVVQSWMDVSSGVTFGLVWKPKTATGTVKWKITVVKVKTGDVENALTETTETITRTAGVVNTVDTFLYTKIGISDLQVGNLIVVKVERTGSADTNAGKAHRREFQARVYRCLEGSGV